MSQDCLMSGCQRKFSMENCKKESAHKVAKRNATKTPLKPRLRISIFKLSLGNRPLRIEQSGVASLTKVPRNLKQRASEKLKGSVKKGKQEPRDHHQTQNSPNSLALFATDSLELKLAYSAINEHTNIQTPYIQDLRWSFSVMRDEQSSLIYLSSEEINEHHLEFHIHGTLNMTMTLLTPFSYNF